MELLAGGEFIGDDACKVLGGRWESTAPARVQVELGPTSGLYCDFRFPMVDLLRRPMQVAPDGETLVMDADGEEPVELVRASRAGSGAGGQRPAITSSPGAYPLAADASGLIATTSTDGTAAFVLVAVEANGEEALLSGPLEVVGGCLGVAGSVVLWPPGTVVLAPDPLTLGIPGLGVASIGDTLALSGGFGVSSADTSGRTDSGQAVPDVCLDPAYFYSGTATEAD